MTKNYELTYLISLKAEAAEREKVAADIRELLKTKGGEITKESSLSEVALGYLIKDEERAGLVALNFSFDDQGLTELKKDLDQETKLLRYILMEKAIAKARRPVRSEKFKGTQKVELEDIDKKIEEIFNPVRKSEISNGVNPQKDEPQ